MMRLVGDDLATDEDVQAQMAASIRANYVSLTPSSLAFAHIVLGIAVAVFWNHVELDGLLFWAAVQSMLMLTSSVVARSAAAENFARIAVLGEGLCAVWWAMIAFLALPESADWQTMQGVLLIGLLLSTLGNATASRSLHLASTVPLGVLGSIAFTLEGIGAARWMAAGFSIALPFTVAAGAVVRQVQADLFTTSLRNEKLAASLRTEGARLRDANDQLETANTHLDQQSRRDTLTGLYNRAGFLGLLNRAVSARPGEIVVCYLDIDGFKRVNDAFGHRFGDLILCAASRRIARVLGPNEVLARQGGDEMTIFGDISEMEGGVEDLGKRILSVFEDPFLIEGRHVEVTVSVGLVWLPEYTTADDLMRFADTALYKAKDLGRAQYAIFDQAMRNELDRRTQLQIDLGAAFSKSEITPYLQPIVDVRTGRIASAEALARWEHVDGVRAATDFIDTARDLGMLDRINDIVVHNVFKFQENRPADALASCPITMNVSPLHLDAMLNRVLQETDHDSVIFEITEDGIFEDLDRARGQLARAQKAGIKVLLDDFGVGFSSLSIATQLPIDGFKIDRGFVASLAGNPSAVAAVEAIIQLADRMDLHVVAEGVETQEQLDLLRQLGVGFAQGYLFSPAVPMATFRTWLDRNHHFEVANPAASIPTS